MNLDTALGRDLVYLDVLFTKTNLGFWT